jgi:YVTN family beta-propeller protein
MWISPDSRLYVACERAKTIVVIDPFTYTRIRTINIGVLKKPASMLSPKSVTGFPYPKYKHYFTTAAKMYMMGASKK